MRKRTIRIEGREKFLARIEEGLRECSLGELLRLEPDLPARSLVLRWMRDDPEFAGRCLEARRDRAELLLESVQEELWHVSDVDAAKVAQIKIRHLEWYLERLIPATYGRRTRMDLGGGISVAALLAEARKRMGPVIEAKSLPESAS